MNRADGYDIFFKNSKNQLKFTKNCVLALAPCTKLKLYEINKNIFLWLIRSISYLVYKACD